MELDFSTNSFLDDSIYEIGVDTDTCGLENERCGICMDVIIDRGLLDCCHHWFCFGCIDNWATITNLCPLCQNEFQLITCVPVYDTIGGGKIEDDSLSRDDDWCIQGTNNTLSFPSYYIDENAVICLDGDGCKIRNGVATGGDDTILDTSIACDSCDIWYHAFCVEFDPESTSENSWLCPRCIDEVPLKSAGVSTQISKNHFSPETASCEQRIKGSHSGNVSVSVADAGETAVVVSMIEGIRETRENCLQAQDIEQKNQTLEENSSTLLSVADAGETAVSVSMIKGNHWIKETHENCLQAQDIDQKNQTVEENSSTPVSVADAGETAVVVSMMEGNHWIKETRENCPQAQDIDQKNQTVDENSSTQLYLDAKEKSLALSLSQDTHLTVPCDSLPLCELETGIADGAESEPSASAKCATFSGLLSDKPDIERKIELDVEVQLGLSVGSSLPADKMNNDAKEDHKSDVSHSHKPFKDSPAPDFCNELSVDGMSLIANEVGSCSVKRKSMSSSRDHVLLTGHTEMDVIKTGDEKGSDPPTKKAKVGGKSQQTCLKANGRKPLSGSSQDSSHRPADSKYEVHNNSDRDEIVADPSPKKAKGDRRSQRACLKDEGKKPIPGGSQESSHLPTGSKYKVDSRYTRNVIMDKVHANKTKADGKSQQAQLKPDVRKPVSGSTEECAPTSAGSKDDKLRGVSEQENNIPDIMSIVRETSQRRDTVTCSPAPKSLMERDTGAKLRVKKIMRRAAQDESSKLVENLRKDIREAVRTKATNDFSKTDLFDPKLLLAFRNAIARPRTEHETVKRLNPSIVRAKKSMLQKGKIRENLTKKIYGNSNGKRKRAWDRDWEVEFWKHRCKRATKPEKVETLKSVLDLLRRSSDSSEMENEPGEKTTNPILSRLYLADTSVFPRKDDIKPLSALTGSGNDKNNKEHVVKEVFPKPVHDKNTSQTPSHISKNSSLYSKDEASRKKVFSNGSVDKQCTASLASGSEVNDPSVKEVPSKSDVKSDKRKWALEVLARKTSTIQRTPTEEKDEDDCMFKGKFPLLAQLPSDMRPVLATCRHSKIPISVRQAQLYRLTEHFLRKADLPTIRRTADTELAVADAVNIEKDVVNRSSSKLVYLNLCSQVVSQHTNNNKDDSIAESDPSESLAPAESMDPNPRVPSDLSAEAALRMAGLVSDSPPNSPCQPEVGNTDQSANGDKGPENVFDMDSHAELDIYGDFEYDLASEDYIGGVVPKVLKIQTEEGDSKMRVVFSSSSIPKTDDVIDPKDDDRLETVNEQKNSFFHGLHTDEGVPTLEVRIESSCPQPECLHEEIDGEPSYAECEELYGPDKEPSVDRFLDKASRAADISTGTDTLTEENICVTSGLPPVGDSSGGHKSSDHYLGNEIPRKEKKTNKAKQSEIIRSISRKVEAYIKEHIRPLCKSGVISIEQYRWSVEKTTAKIMKYHSKDSNANFLIKEGEKVKKLAEQYVEAAQKMDGS